jgi:hypothetical protein
MSGLSQFGEKCRMFLNLLYAIFSCMLVCYTLILRMTSNMIQTRNQENPTLNFLNVHKIIQSSEPQSQKSL